MPSPNHYKGGPGPPTLCLNDTSSPPNTGGPGGTTLHQINSPMVSVDNQSVACCLTPPCCNCQGGSCHSDNSGGPPQGVPGPIGHNLYA